MSYQAALAPIEAVALWDTGAGVSAINVGIVKRLGLEELSFTTIQTPSGEMDCGVYLVDIELPGGITISGVRVVAAKHSGSDVLLGMNVIGLGDFAVSCAGDKTSFAFRFPPQGLVGFE
jgi:predicted aspartyl protease